MIVSNGMFQYNSPAGHQVGASIPTNKIENLDGRRAH